MKRFIFFLLAWLFLIGTAYGAARTTITKDSSGTMSHVTAYKTEAGVTVWEIIDGGASIFAIQYSNLPITSGESGYISIYDSTTTGFIGIPSISGTSVKNLALISGTLLNTQLPDPITNDINANIARSGASLIVDPPSGATLLQSMHNCIIRHDSATWDWLALPVISGTSTIYFKVIEGAAGSGVTFQTADSQPFLGYDISGISTWVLPPGNQFSSFSLYGTASGTSKWWFVEDSGTGETRL